eukprot:scaffold2829_cov119-Isochrysis_galbana.AAC.7
MGMGRSTWSKKIAASTTPLAPSLEGPVGARRCAAMPGTLLIKLSRGSLPCITKPGFYSLFTVHGLPRLVHFAFLSFVLVICAPPGSAGFS